MNSKRENKDLDITIGLQEKEQWEKGKLSKLKAFITKESEKQSAQRVMRNNMLSIEYLIEDYIENDDDSDKLEVNHFVKLYLSHMNLTKGKFASVIEMNYSNLYKYLIGDRKLNADLAMKFSRFFDTSPEVWIMIQVKNEIIKIKSDKKTLNKYDKYDYKNILEID